MTKKSYRGIDSGRRFDCGDHNDHGGEKPEGLHDPDDDEGIGPDAVGQHGEEPGQITQGQAPEKVVLGLAESQVGILINHIEEHNEKNKSDQSRLRQDPGVLSIYERITRDAVTQKGLFDEIFSQNDLPGGETGGGRGVDPGVAHLDLTLFPVLGKGV